MQKNGNERRQFFKDLRQHCSREDVYSVGETIEAMGVTCEQANKWINNNQSFGRIVEECRAMCLEHARKALKTEPILSQKWRELDAYILENDDEAAQKYDDAREKERIEQEERNKKQKIKDDREKELKKGIMLALKIEESQENPVVDESTNSNQLTQCCEQRESADKERLKVWGEKKAKENAGFTVNKNNAKSTDEIIYLEPKFKNSNLTPEEKNDLVNASFCAATGTASSHVNGIIITTTLSAIHRTNPDAAPMINATQDALLAMKPNDVFEGMLCSRLWILQNQATTYMSRAAQSDNTQTVDLNISRAIKLMRLQNETLDALNKHRRKGEQKVTVQHVNVNNGGQAVVAGTFTRGEGTNDKHKGAPDAN